MDLPTNAETAGHIRNSLRDLGLSDIDHVTGKLEVCGSTKRDGTIQAKYLSDLCLPAEQIGNLIPHDPHESLEQRLHMSRDGQVVGLVDCYGTFYYLRADTLRTYIGWIAATDYGRRGRLNGFNLDSVTRNIEAAIREAFTKDDLLAVYQGPWAQTLKANLTSITSGGDWSWHGERLWIDAAWIVLGKKHDGFSFEIMQRSFASRQKPQPPS